MFKLSHWNWKMISQFERTIHICRSFFMISNSTNGSPAIGIQRRPHISHDANLLQFRQHKASNVLSWPERKWHPSGTEEWESIFGSRSFRRSWVNIHFCPVINQNGQANLFDSIPLQCIQEFAVTIAAALVVQLLLTVHRGRGCAVVGAGQCHSARTQATGADDEWTRFDTTAQRVFHTKSIDLSIIERADEPIVFIKTFSYEYFTFCINISQQ